MRSVVQRVESCTLSVDGKEIAGIGRGLVCYLGVQAGDGDNDLQWMIKKVGKLRVFPDSEGKMNLSAFDLGLDILVVPQFTLFGDVRRGFRPSFSDAEEPGKAKKMWEVFIEGLRTLGIRKVAGGVFGADMTINQLNRGPVTIELDSRKTELTQLSHKSPQSYKEHKENEEQ